MPKFTPLEGVIDTSCLLNLLHLGLVKNLSLRYRRVYIPKYVIEETNRKGKGRYPLKGALRTYSFLKRCSILDPISAQMLYDKKLNPAAPIDRGEAEAIIQARERRISQVLIDDGAGRDAAERHSLEVTGTLGLLADFKRLGLIKDVGPLVEKLIAEVGYRIHRNIVKRVLKEIGEA